MLPRTRATGVIRALTLHSPHGPLSDGTECARLIVYTVQGIHTSIASPLLLCAVSPSQHVSNLFGSTPMVQ